MSRCEDYPCCGHAGDPDGCPDFSRENECEDCGRSFHPDGGTERFCHRCLAQWRAERESDDQYEREE